MSPSWPVSVSDAGLTEPNSDISDTRLETPEIGCMAVLNLAHGITMFMLAMML